MYYQIKRELERRIRHGELPAGARVPTEHGLCRAHGVSRITARRALELLREEGLIDRARGRGSFVAEGAGSSGKPGAGGRGTEIGVVSRGVLANLSAERDDWCAAITRSLEQHVQAEGHHLVLLPANSGASTLDPRLEGRLKELEGRLGGVVCFAGSQAPPVLEALEKRGIPWVTINLIDRRQTQNFVAVDNYGGGYQVGQLFARLGYEPVLVLGTSLSLTISIADKFFGFTHGYLEGGRRNDAIRFFPVEHAAGGARDHRALRQLLQGAARPRAIFCTGDLLAAGVLRLCRELGIAVPEELAVVGGTGLAFAEQTAPPLSVLAQPMMEVGQEAARFLLEMIRTGARSLPGRYVFSPLVLRQSCPKAPRR